ncbi:MAG TPA: ABC transporter permease [Polyangiaceae bacterium]|jgi:peptide/nickel transport system permease protein|nr:ABC transporter permease [Polyangiaceae bacterium]
MIAAPADVAAGAAESDARVSYAGLVFGELRKSRTTLVGLWCIAGLSLVAVYAPLLSLDQPIAWNEGAGWSFPLLRALFNRLLFENSIDVFFNLGLVLSPLYAAMAVVARKRRALRALGNGKLVGALALFHVLAFTAVAPERFAGAENPLFHSSAIVAYRTRAESLTAEGHAPRAVFPLHRYGYRETNPGESVNPPSRRHWLGTDTEGRDVLARMLYGTRISLTIGVIAVAIYVVIGVVLGALAGYFGGWVDGVISRFIEVMICFPSFFLILTLAAVIEQRSIFHVMVIIGVTSWTGVARLIRAEFLKHKELEYTQAALALGIPKRRIIFRHILPNAIAPVLVSATFGVASAILIESSLSFLGVGDPSVASWGETLNTGRLEGKPWLIFAPGLAIFLVVTVFNLVGEGLRDALDPKLRSR